MDKLKAGGYVAALILAVAVPQASRADDAQLDRTKEMLRRTQEALRQAQAQNAELARANADAEQKAAAATASAAKQIDSAKKASLRGSTSKLKTARDGQAETTQKLAAVNTLLAQTTEKQRVTAQVLANREAELEQTKTLLERSKAATVSCEGKNDKLYTYGAELLQQYQHKGVFSALAQKEPVFGLKQVQIENVVQEYRIKMAAEKIAK